MKERSAYQVTTIVKSASVGVDWLMIRAAKEAVRKQRDSQKQVQVNSDVHNQKKQDAHTP